MPGIMRYSPAMEKLTVDTLRTLARARGLDLTDQELAALLPLVEAGRSGLAAMTRYTAGPRAGFAVPHSLSEDTP